MNKLEVVDIETVSNVLGISDRTIRTWVKDFGCPSRKDGRSLTFHWPDVLAWYVEYASSRRNGVTSDFAPTVEDDAEPSDKESLNSAMLRKTRAEADLKQLALSKLRGEVIVIGDAKTRLDRMLGNLRTQLLNMAPKLATRLAGERDPIAQEAAIKDEMESLCRELATGQVLKQTDTADTEDASTIDDPEMIDTLTASAEDEAVDQIAGFLVRTYELLTAADLTYVALQR